jgi:putative OPT family oligopeptide transporter
VALLAVGYIVGLNIALLVFAWGCIAWLFGIPIYSALYGLPEGLTGYDAAYELWSTKIRYMGVGAMAAGGIWALVSLVGPIRDGIQSSLKAIRQRREKGSVDIPRTELDTPINFVIYGALALAIPTFIVFMYVVDQGGLGITTGLYISTLVFGVLFALLAGFLFSSVAAYMAGLVGSSNNPISGVTIATILTTSLILLWMLGTQIDFTVKESAGTAAATAILVGAVVCCAAAIGGDNMQDLKAGHIVGATPLKQQIMQMVGVLAAAAVIAPVLSLLFHAYGMAGVFPRPGMPEEAMLDAPQATLMASVAQGVFARNLPWAMISVGVGIAIAIILLDQYLKARGSDFRTPVLAVAVGIYLPIELSVPIFIGGLVAYFASRRIEKTDWSLTDLTPDKAQELGGRNGLLFSSGLIAGEALIGIFLAVPFAAYESSDVLRIVGAGFTPVAKVLGVVAFAGFTYWLYRVASRPSAEDTV